MSCTRVGDGVLYLGNALSLLPNLDGVVDGVITDPPYSSGGVHSGDRCRPPSEKYEQNGVKNPHASFAHDAKDQRSFVSWCSEWLSQLPVKEGGYVLVFIDWRQLPAMTDAFQWAGLIWRGVCPWDKGLGSRAPHKGYARHQAEYVVWGTKGPCRKSVHGGPWPGVYRHPVLQKDKFHMAGKPTALLRELVQWIPPGGVILDPFMGSGTTGVAALLEGRRFIGIEVEDVHFQTAVKRVEEVAG